MTTQLDTAVCRNCGTGIYFGPFGRYEPGLDGAALQNMWRHLNGYAACRNLRTSAEVGFPDLINAKHLWQMRLWSDETFGPGRRQLGIIDHIRRELAEVETAADGQELLGEWVDVIILGLDGATRCGATPEQVIQAIHAKWERNRTRTWPDWREFSEDEAIEHDRTVAE